MDRNNMRNSHQMLSSGGIQKRSQHQQQQSHQQSNMQQQPPLSLLPHHQQQQQQQQHHQQHHHSSRSGESLAQHDELIKYIEESWHKVTSEQGPHGITYYNNDTDPRILANFQPFDLEGFWGRKAVQNIHITRSHQ